jgi:hypothetical protein
MTTLLDCDYPTLTGRQEPEFLLFDEGDYSEAEKALTFAARIGINPLPWQQDTVRGILALEPDGLFTHPTAADVAPRQNGKTLTAADLRILFGLFYRGEKIVYSAQRWSTAESIFKRVKRIIGRRPSLRNRVVRQTCSQGQASIELKSGALVSFITRSLDAGRGFDEIDLIIYDEAYNLKDAETAALSPTQLASRNPQTIYLSSAVNELMHANGHVLAGIRDRALKSIATGVTHSGLYYAEYAAPKPSDDLTDAARRVIREDPQIWRLANPSYGVIQTEAKVRKLLYDLSAIAFEVEVLGWGHWPLIGGSERPLEAKWPDLVDPAPALVRHYPGAIAVDRCPLTKTWAIAGAQYTDSGNIHIEVGYSQTASHTDVVEKLIDIVTEADPAVLVIESRSGAAILKPYLIQAGVEPHLTNTTELALACEGMLEGVATEQVTHSGQQILTDAVAATIKRDLPGDRFAWDALPGGSITQIVAGTLAHWGLLTFASPPKRSLPPMSGQEEVSENLSSDEKDWDSVPF